MKKPVLKKESKAGREKKKLSFITDSKAAKKIREIVDYDGWRDVRTQDQPLCAHAVIGIPRTVTGEIFRANTAANRHLIGKHAHACQCIESCAARLRVDNRAIRQIDFIGRNCRCNYIFHFIFRPPVSAGIHQ